MSPEDEWGGRARAFNQKLMGWGQVTLRRRDLGEFAGFGRGSTCWRTAVGFPRSQQEK